MIHNQFNLVNKKKGVKIPNARARAGWGKGIYLYIGGSPAKRAKAGGQKGRGFRSLGPQEFLPARRNFRRSSCRASRGSQFRSK